MFTGIVQEIGEIVCVERHANVAHIKVKTALTLDDVRPSDSIAVNGVCLTVTAKDPQGQTLEFDVGHETLTITSFADAKEGDKVHLEKALLFSERLHGHLVQGHVDSLGQIAYLEHAGSNLLLGITCSSSVIAQCILKGSICVDGVSLTINRLSQDIFEVCLIPYTLTHTLFASYKIHQRVNLELDIIGKYVAAHVAHGIHLRGLL